MDQDPRWLSEEELASWLAFAQVLMRLPGALDSQLQREAGMSHVEYLVLAGLSMSEGRRMLMRDVARFSGSSLPRLSNVVTRLEKRGWVTREPVPDDRRSTYAVLTDAGMTQVEATAPTHVAGVRDLVVDRLTPEQLGALAEASRAVLDAIDPGGFRAPGA